MRKALTVLAAVAALVPTGATGQMKIRDTPHNLSASGPSEIRAKSETRICIFCHTSHNASPQGPMWNREEPGSTFDIYWSPTVDAYSSAAAAPQPNGASKLCLSCHDGTIALGSTVAGGEIPMVGGLRRLPSASRANLGADMTGDHPISIRITDDLVQRNNSKGDVPLKSLAEMEANPDVRLDDGDRVQCTSCHDPHTNANGSFLHTERTGDLCLGCHY
jgi:predicted CXXCH cytochrome family protein